MYPKKLASFAAFVCWPLALSSTSNQIDRLGRFLYKQIRQTKPAGYEPSFCVTANRFISWSQDRMWCFTTSKHCLFLFAWCFLTSFQYWSGWHWNFCPSVSPLQIFAVSHWVNFEFTFLVWTDQGFKAGGLLTEFSQRTVVSPLRGASYLATLRLLTVFK